MSSLRMMAIDEICLRGSVRDGDVAMLRRALTRSSELAAADADSLFRIHEACRVQDPAWAELFITTLTDYVVRELEPSGYLTAVHGGWLIARLSRHGRINTKTELDLLLTVLDKARWAPESLIGFALGQARASVANGDGPLRLGAEAPAGTITVGEVEFVSRVLNAINAEGMLDLTRVEMEALFEIDGAIIPLDGPAYASGHVLWADLIDKAVANAAMAASGYAGPGREQALRPGVVLWPLPIDPPRPVQLVGREAGSVLAAYRRLLPEERALQRLERQRIEIITGEPAREVDATWLADRIARGQRHGRSYCNAMVALRACGAALHPAIADLAERTVKAA